MRWVNFPDGSIYTFAVDIQNFAEANGYSAPRERDGTRHPGTDCNAKMRMIMKDAGMRTTFGVTESSVVDVRMDDNPINESFLRFLVSCEVVSPTYLRNRVIQLYSIQAVNALLSVMLKTHVRYEFDHLDEHLHVDYTVVTTAHNLEKRKNKPKASLFKK